MEPEGSWPHSQEPAEMTIINVETLSRAFEIELLLCLSSTLIRLIILCAIKNIQ